MRKLISIICSILVASSAIADNVKDKDKVSKHVNLKEVVVNASRSGLKLKNMPGKVEIITSRTIEHTSANNLGDLLKKTAGIDIVQYPGMLTGISMRGFSPKMGENNYTVILIDGVPAGTNNIATISIENIESIEILKGPYSSLYGSQAMGGIINIVTKKNTGDLATQLTLAYGSYDKQSINLNMGGNLTNELSFRISAQREKQKRDYEIGNNSFFASGTKEREYLGLDKGEIDINNSTYAKDNFDAKLIYNINNVFSASLNYSYFEGKDVRNPGSVFAPWPTIKDLQRHNTSLNVTAKKGNHKLSATTFYSTDNSQDYEGVDASKYINLDKEYKVIGTQLNDVISFDKHKLTFGIDYKKDDYKSKRWDSEQKPTNPYNPDYFNTKLAAYIQANLNFLDEKLTVSAGLRADKIKLKIAEDELLNSKEQTENYKEVNYNIGAKYKICEDFSAYSSFGTAFLSPTALHMAGAYEFSYSVFWDGVEYAGKNRYKGNPDLDPETSNTFELGLNYSKDKFSADISWFSTNYENKITQEKKSDDMGDYYTYKNSEKAQMRGFEAELSYDLTECFDNNISIEPYLKWTYLYHAKEENDNKETDLLYVKKHNAIFGLKISDMAKFDSNISFKYAGKRKETAMGIDGPFEMPQYFVVDVSASYRINEMFKLGLYANNLLDERYCEKYGYLLPGRNFMAKICMKF